jgi:hypothetical protein
MIAREFVPIVTCVRMRGFGTDSRRLTARDFRVSGRTERDVGYGLMDHAARRRRGAGTSGVEFRFGGGNPVLKVVEYEREPMPLFWSDEG